LIDRANGTHEELVVYMQSRNDLTDLELELFSRLTAAVDEIDALSLDLGIKEGHCGLDARSES
jgi:hypothetical protein